MGFGPTDRRAFLGLGCRRGGRERLRTGAQGTWLYHDHGPMDPLPVFRGLFEIVG